MVFRAPTDPNTRPEPDPDTDMALAARGLSSQRERWIREHSEFLTQALSGKRRVPRIPRRRVDRGGFGIFLSRPGVRELMEQWWERVLGMMD